MLYENNAIIAALVAGRGDLSDASEIVNPSNTRIRIVASITDAMSNTSTMSAESVLAAWANTKRGSCARLIATFMNGSLTKNPPNEYRLARDEAVRMLAREYNGASPKNEGVVLAFDVVAASNDIRNSAAALEYMGRCATDVGFRCFAVFWLAFVVELYSTGCIPGRSQC